MIDKADRFVVELKKRHAGSVVKVTHSPRYDGFAALCPTRIIIPDRDSALRYHLLLLVSGFINLSLVRPRLGQCMNVKSYFFTSCVDKVNREEEKKG